MSGKRVKKVDPDQVSKRNVENTKFAEQVARSIKRKQENLDMNNLYCAIDNCRCDGPCRKTNTVNGILECSEIIAKP